MFRKVHLQKHENNLVNIVVHKKAINKKWSKILRLDNGRIGLDPGPKIQLGPNHGSRSNIQFRPQMSSVLSVYGLTDLTGFGSVETVIHLKKKTLKTKKYII